VKNQPSLRSGLVYTRCCDVPSVHKFLGGLWRSRSARFFSSSIDQDRSRPYVLYPPILIAFSGVGPLVVPIYYIIQPLDFGLWTSSSPSSPFASSDEGLLGSFTRGPRRRRSPPQWRLALVSVHCRPPRRRSFRWCGWTLLGNDVE
jgi:hypothetical protein